MVTIAIKVCQTTRNNHDKLMCELPMPRRPFERGRSLAKAHMCAPVLSGCIVRRELNVNATQLEADIRNALHSLNAVTEKAIGQELAKRFDLGDCGCLQFEVDPLFLRITLIQTEKDVLPDSAVFAALPEGFEDQAEAAGLDPQAAMSQLLFPWFAERWQEAGGPRQFRPAYAFFHGGLHEPRYDLEQCRWCDTKEIWP